MESERSNEKEPREQGVMEAEGASGRDSVGGKGRQCLRDRFNQSTENH